MTSKTQTWQRASLRISSGHRKLVDIERVLESEPDIGHDIGTRRGPDPNARVRQQSLWVQESGLAAEVPLEEHIETLMDFVDAHSKAIRELASDCEFELFCAFSSESGQGSLQLSPEMLQRIAAYPIWIVLDLYPPEE